MDPFVKELITTIVLSVVGVVVSSLGSLLFSWIKTKITNEKHAQLLEQALRVVDDGVTYVYQTYVENLKGTDLWDKEAMNTANQKAVDYITNHLPADIVKFITDNNKELTEWILEQIEIAVQNNKK